MCCIVFQTDGLMTMIIDSNVVLLKTVHRGIEMVRTRSIDQLA